MCSNGMIKTTVFPAESSLSTRTEISTHSPSCFQARRCSAPPAQHEIQRAAIELPAWRLITCVAGRVVDEGPACALRRDQSMDSVAERSRRNRFEILVGKGISPQDRRRFARPRARCRNCNRFRWSSWWSSRSGNTHRAACWFFAQVQPAADNPAACPESHSSGMPATRSRRTPQTKRWKPSAAGADVQKSRCVRTGCSTKR